MKYIVKKIWFLILLLLISAVAVLGKFKNWVLYPFFCEYFKFAIYVIIAGNIAHYLGETIPRSLNYKNSPFAPFEWEENGRFYQKTLHISKWKDKMIDMGKASASTAAKQIGDTVSEDSIEFMIQETCKAEITHFAIIVFSPIMFIFMTAPYSFFGVILYDLSNLFDIIIQRYNRPRLVRLLEKLKNKSVKKLEATRV